MDRIGEAVGEVSILTLRTNETMRHRVCRRSLDLPFSSVIQGLVALFTFLVLSPGNGYTREETFLSVGHAGHDHQLALYIALDRGEDLKKDSGGIWFEPLKPFEVYLMRRGEQVVAQVAVKKVQGGSGMPTSLASGAIDVGVGGVAATIATFDKGGKVKIIAPCNSDGDLLLMRPDFPAQSWAEFVTAVKGSEVPVKIGYKAPQAVAYLILKAALTEEGIPFGMTPAEENGRKNQVILVNMGGESSMAPALISRAIDGIVCNQPTPAVIEAKGIGRILADLRDLPPEGKWHNHPCCCVAARTDVLEAKPLAVQALLQAIVAGGKTIASNPEQAAVIASKWTGIPEAVERKSLATVQYVTEPDEGWKTGMFTWFELMNGMNGFDDRLKGLSPAAMYDLTSDFTLLERALLAIGSEK